MRVFLHGFICKVHLPEFEIIQTNEENIVIFIWYDFKFIYGRLHICLTQNQFLSEIPDEEGLLSYFIVSECESKILGITKLDLAYIISFLKVMVQLIFLGLSAQSKNKALCDISLCLFLRVKIETFPHCIWLRFFPCVPCFTWFLSILLCKIISCIWVESFALAHRYWFFCKCHYCLLFWLILLICGKKCCCFTYFMINSYIMGVISNNMMDSNISSNEEDHSVIWDEINILMNWSVQQRIGLL